MRKKLLFSTHLQLGRVKNIPINKLYKIFIAMREKINDLYAVFIGPKQKDPLTNIFIRAINKKRMYL